MHRENRVILGVFCNLFTKKGKKALAEKLLLRTFFYLRSRYKVQSPSDFILKLLSKLRPVLGVTFKQVASMKVKLPIKLNSRQSYFKAMRWLVEGAKKRSTSDYLTSENLAKEIYESSASNGYTFAKKQLKEHKSNLRDTRAFLRYLK